MKITVTRQEIEEAILVHIFAKSGLNLSTKKVNISFFQKGWEHNITHAEVDF